MWSSLSELEPDSTAMGVSVEGRENKQEERGGGTGIGECVRGQWRRNCSSHST